jgi:hypothetical protein
MKQLLVIAAALLALGAQDHDPTVDTDGHLKAEHQIPAGHYCQTTRVYDENAQRLAARGLTPANAHPCDCSYTCHVDANGSPMETGGEKTTNCKSYCSKDGRRCTCHVEDPCPPADGQARVDMTGTVVAVGRHR